MKTRPHPIRKVLDIPTPADLLTYQIDSADRITSVSGSWDLFAAANDGGTRATDVVGHSLWDFVVHNTTRQVYRDLIARVRGGRPVTFSYRCDSPTLRRFMRMTMRPGASGPVICSGSAGGATFVTCPRHCLEGDSTLQRVSLR